MPNEIRWFSAQYRGECAACGKWFHPGDNIGYLVDNELVGEECCAGIGTNLNEWAFKNIWPTGKTIADMCPKCFLIHSEGQTECE